MLEQAFNSVYSKFKLHFYKAIFSKFGEREASLTTVETFCMEIIHALNKPTINEFASFISISAPNAAYKVNNLIQKGYINKTQSTDDKREYYIEPTQKFYDYYNLSHNYITTVISRVEDRLPEEDIEAFSRILSIISNELMPEIPNLKQ